MSKIENTLDVSEASEKAQRMFISAISFPRNQVATPRLVNNMSSGVPGPNLGHLFPKLEYWGPFEALAEKCENTIHISKIRLDG